MEQEIFKDENGILKCTRIYYTNVCIINEVVVQGDLEIIIMIIIKNLEDDDETTLCIEIYNNNVPDNIIQSNYMSFSCEYNDLENELIDVLDKKHIEYYSCIKELNIVLMIGLLLNNISR